MERSLLAAEETRWICERSESLGLALCGVVPAGQFPELQHYREWLDRGYAGEMKYLADPRRFDPRVAVPEAHSLIVSALMPTPGPSTSAQPQNMQGSAGSARTPY